MYIRTYVFVSFETTPVIRIQILIDPTFNKGESAWAGTPLGRYTPGQVHCPLPALDRYTPGQVHYPPGRYTPWAGTHPPAGTSAPEQCMLGDTGNKWVVCILLECILVLFVCCFFGGAGVG